MAATAIDKTAFNPYIAQLGMPPQGMFSAFGGAVDDYEKKKKTDILFGLDERNKTLTLDKTQFDLDQAKVNAPLDTQTKQNNLNKSVLDVEKTTFDKDNGVWKNSADKTKSEAGSAAQKLITDTAEASNKDASIKADIGYKNAATASSNASAKASTTAEQINQLKLTAQKSDDAITQASYYFLTDSNGDGIIDSKDFDAVKKTLVEKGVDEKFINGAYMKAQTDIAKLNELKSKEQKNLGIKHTQGTVGDAATQKTAKTLALAEGVDLMVKNYDPANVGFIDGFLDDASQKLDIRASEEKGNFMSSVGLYNSILRNELFGASLTDNEIKSAKEWMPDRYSSEIDFKAKTKGLLNYYKNVIDTRFNALPPEKQSSYKDTYKQYMVEINDSIDNMDKNWGANRKKTTTPTEGNGTKGTAKFSASKESNTSKPTLDPFNY